MLYDWNTAMSRSRRPVMNASHGGRHPMRRSGAKGTRKSLEDVLFSATSSRQKNGCQEIDSIQCASVSESVVGDSHACLASLNQRQDDRAIPIWLMIDRIVSPPPAPVVVQRLAGVRVDIKPGKVAAGNIPAGFGVPCRIQGTLVHPDLEPINLPRLHRERFLREFAIPRPHDAIRDVQLGHADSPRWEGRHQSAWP